MLHRARLRGLNRARDGRARAIPLRRARPLQKQPGLTCKATPLRPLEAPCYPSAFRSTLRRLCEHRRKRIANGGAPGPPTGEGRASTRAAGRPCARVGRPTSAEMRPRSRCSVAAARRKVVVVGVAARVATRHAAAARTPEGLTAPGARPAYGQACGDSLRAQLTTPSRARRPISAELRPSSPASTASVCSPRAGARWTDVRGTAEKSSGVPGIR